MKRVVREKKISDMSIASVITGRSVISEVVNYKESAPELEWDAELWPELHSEHITEIHKANVFKMGQARDVYNYLSNNYDGMYQRLNYIDHLMVKEMLLE